jgi:hypothetical protein
VVENGYETARGVINATNCSFVYLEATVCGTLTECTIGTNIINASINPYDTITGMPTGGVSLILNNCTITDSGNFLGEGEITLNDCDFNLGAYAAPIYEAPMGILGGSVKFNGSQKISMNMNSYIQDVICYGVAPFNMYYNNCYLVSSTQL